MPAQRNRPFYISTQATQVICPGPGTLVAVNVNTGVTSAVVTLYDALSAVSGKKIATIDAASKSCQVFAVYCETGLTAVSSGANPDVTVTYQ